MIEELDGVLEGNGQLGLPELRRSLQELLGGPSATGRVLDQHRLKSCVYRLHFEVNGCVRSLVVKRLEPSIARRNQLVATRWLPAIALRANGPPLLGTAAERNGLCTAAHTQLAEDPLYVRADSLLTDSELLRDLALGQSFGQQTKHFEFALCQH